MIDIDRWMRDYIKAWRSDYPADIEALFAENAVYLTAPTADPISGRAAIVEWWREEPEPAEPDFSWWAIAVTDDTAVVQCHTTYPGHASYQNLWVISFDGGGRATSFTEWFVAEDT